MSKNTLIYISFFLFIQVGKSQDSVPFITLTKLRSIEGKAGALISFIPGTKFNRFPLNVNVAYIHSIKNHLSFISYSDFYSNRRKDGESYDFNYRHWVESIGIGGSFSSNIITQNIFLMAGARHYYSKLIVNDDEVNAALVTKRWTPDVGILYNVNISKHRLYFCWQFYLSVLPIKNVLENKHQVSLGLGYKLHTK